MTFNYLFTFFQYSKSNKTNKISLINNLVNEYPGTIGDINFKNMF